MPSTIKTPDWLAIVADWLAQATEMPSADAFRHYAIGNLLAAVGADWGAIAESKQGSWSASCEVGQAQSLPAALLSDALDREQALTLGGWWVGPLTPHGQSGELLVLHIPAGSERVAGSLPAAALALGQIVEQIRQQTRYKLDRSRLRAILDAASQWYRIHEMGPLLEQIARAATQLVRADRASIFIWDHRQHELVGRPALGVAGGELRIPDDSGIVGQVVQSGQARRVDLENGQAFIDRRVDKTLGYQTQTLLCVPLRGAGGDVIGAFEAINKRHGNFTDDDEATLTELAAHASIALANTQDRRRLVESRRQLTDLAAQRVQFIGQSPAIEALRSTIGRVAQTDLAVLVLGENGTGKDVIAQSIHFQSARRDQPLVAINCAAIPETLLESELFGHEKGAFTDARETRAGKFELAHSGTLFLDEIGDMSLGGQAKLLRVVEDRVIVRVGGSKTIPVDVRLVVATNQDLAELVHQKKFRQDLYYRLNVVSLTVPPLRERGSDIVLLAEHFLHDFAIKARRSPPTLTSAAQRKLEAHPWPGNVRELRNSMERLAYLSSSDVIDADELQFIMSPSGESRGTLTVSGPLNEATEQFQIEYIQRAVRMSDGNMSRTAELLGLHRSNLYRKMKQLGMEVEP